MPRKFLPWLTVVLSISLIALAAMPALAPHPARAALSRPDAATAQHATTQRATTQPGYGQVPLAFELNEGQTSGAVRFLAHGSGYTIFLTPSAAVLSLQQGLAPASGKMGPDAFARTGSAMPASAPAQTLGMRWLGANPDPIITGEDMLPGTVNYFLGNDPKQWHTHIPTYQQVRLHDVYPGVDLVYYGNQGQLEYDFVVAPGADPSRIQLGFSGADRLGLDLAGNLSLSLPDGALQQDQPTIYQTVNGARRAVPGGFTLNANHQVAFALGAYNPHLPLVIDPAYKFSTYLGGSADDQGLAIAVDTSGNAYITGQELSTNFPTTIGAVQTTSDGGNSDAFVTAINASGTAFIYSTYLGGNGGDAGNGIAVDASGNAYVTGSTDSTNFPLASPLQSTLGSVNGDAFVTKLNASGSALVYSTYLGGDGGDNGKGIACDASGNMYVTGLTLSTTFPTTSGALQTSSAGGEEVFVSKLNAAGSALVYSTYLGGSSDDYANGIALDAAGNAYIIGVTYSSNFPTLNPIQATNAGDGDAFVSKLNASGSALVYSTYLGGSFADLGFGIAVDGTGNAYVTGSTQSSDFPTHNPLQATNASYGDEDAFVSKLNVAGSALVYSTYLGGSKIDEGNSVAVNANDDAYVTGYTESTDFPTVNPLQDSLPFGSGSAFVTEFNAAGSLELFSTYLGGAASMMGDYGQGIAVGAGGNVYLTGYTGSSSFPVTPGALQSTFGGVEDAFVTKMLTLPSVDTTTGVFRPSNGVLYLKNANTTGPADITLYYGQPGDQPITGDWTGKGYRSIGIFRNGTFYLRNSNTTGTADIVATFGASGDIPVAGDWTGKGYDSIGVYRPSNSTFYLRDSNTSGPPDHVVTLGISGDVPIVGDWTGKGYDSVGVFRPSNGIVYLRNSNTTGFADISFTYGIAGDKPVVGDWNADGVDTLGVDRGGRLLLRNANSTGPANLSFYLGAASDQPIAGPWLAPLGSIPNHEPATPGKPTAMRTPGASVDHPRRAS